MEEPTQSIENLINLLVNQAHELEIIDSRDIIYFKNCLYQKFKISYTVDIKFTKLTQSTFDTNIPQICQQIIRLLSAQQKQLLGSSYDMIETNIISTLLPPPSYIEQRFWHKYHQLGIKQAIDWYYNYSCSTNYIKMYELEKNQSWITQTQYGNLQITINLSKPEKDPLEIAQLKTKPQDNNLYPKCLLCIENEGFEGSNTLPSRHTHRMIELKLNKQSWFFQFSPYSYYNQHSIVINTKHYDMQINEDTLKAFFDFLDFAPHYIIGSNSDIPIVGGSILNHDHYQAGDYQFPIELSKIKFSLDSTICPNIKINYLNWPISTIQLVGNRVNLLKLGTFLINKWYTYSNPELSIIAKSGDIRHNGITPILRRLDNNLYALYILLRNNRTNSEYPEGIFHPHKNLHHIKKENIGLIEAMGLAILPGRLSTELEEIAKLLLLNNEILGLEYLENNQTLHKHKSWFIELIAKYNRFDITTVNSILQNEIGYKFGQALEHCGVFKNHPDHDTALRDFLNDI
ncbi:MAG: galactose-1-phosphate uridylyltransferase [Neisseriaceae bacterium]